ncbi:MAG: SUMF1/EgtB/PvdO family nonheme iron enzyme [Candidatus Rokubacteria bacterium]|nr:SUMF1/EgtB/PvdO family nonheme iron enzyme [Candidatus Rokubacteria bacterium]
MLPDVSDLHAARVTERAMTRFGFLVACLLSATACATTTESRDPARPPSAESSTARDDAVDGARVALVIGNSKYQHAPPLANPPNDARAMTRVLKRLGFDVARCVERSLRATAELCAEWYGRAVPRHQVTLDTYYLDRFEVTNARFERFVQATGHRTTAEMEGHGWSWQQKDGKWQWVQVDSANWRTPNGRASVAESDHPVVHVSWHDASLQPADSAGPRRDWRAANGHLAVRGDRDEAIRVVGGAVVEQERLVDELDRSPEILQRPRKPRAQLRVRHVVSALRDPLHHARDRERGAFEADEDQNDDESPGARRAEQSELRARRVREHRLRAERHLRLDEGGPKLLGRGECAPVDVTGRCRRIRRAQRRRHTIGVDVRQAEIGQVPLEERGLARPVGSGEKDQNRRSQAVRRPGRFGRRDTLRAAIFSAGGSATNRRPSRWPGVRVPSGSIWTSLPGYAGSVV